MSNFELLAHGAKARARLRPTKTDASRKACNAPEASRPDRSASLRGSRPIGLLKEGKLPSTIDPANTKIDDSPNERAES